MQCDIMPERGVLIQLIVLLIALCSEKYKTGAHHFSEPIFVSIFFTLYSINVSMFLHISFLLVKCY